MEKVMSLFFILALASMDLLLVLIYISECNSVNDFLFYGVIVFVIICESLLPLFGFIDELKD